MEKMEARMSTGRIAELEQIVGSSRLSGFQLLIAVLCASVAMIDGFDTQAIALAAPHIGMAWRVMPSAFGLVFGAGLFGSLVGALAFGVAADRFGRKPCLLVAVLWFGLITLLTPFTRSLDALTLVRFLTGIGLGGALPAVISLTSEYAPSRSRATVVSLMFCGFPLGAVVGGLAAAAAVPKYGWESLFYLGSAVPLVLLPLLALCVPESIRFLAVKGKGAAIARILDRMGLDGAGVGELQAAPPTSPPSMAALFTQGRALGTLLLSGTFLLSLLLSYFLVNWLPLVAHQAGIGIGSAVLGVATLNLGAIVGCLFIGRLVDRYGPAAPIATAYALGAVAIALIGLVGKSSVLFLVTTFVAGLFSVGAQMCIVALCATFYETSLRATGVGWAMGTGRIGAILGPVLGGMLIAAGMSAPRLFLVAGGVSLVAAFGVVTMGLLVLRKVQFAPVGRPPAAAQVMDKASVTPRS
ncbi:MAG: transporter, family, 4-hydroxybenzoate transporter [Caulobacteraceae bacterium]|nr:transporter, family, 4-hydroxybenzoate transporter [Caulobacteraceae bacterium]